jgi:prepilin-type N-terminal cleavage/methylation domain-containing protein
MRNIKNEKGFSLVEVAIVLFISGLVFTMVMFAYKTYATSETLEITQEAIETTQQANFFYRLIYATYPCPADPTLAPNHAQYGVANCTAAGVTRLVGRDADNADGDNDPLTGGDIVLMGAVPFRTLLDPDGDGDETDKVYPTYVAKHGFDSWGNSLTYAVTESLTDIDTDLDGNNDFVYDKDRGAIDIVDEGLYLDPDPIVKKQQASLLQNWGTAHLVVLSHGPNGVGAYNREGNRVQICNLGLTAAEQADKDAANPLGSPPDETENCERTNGRDATFMAGIKNDTKNYYNDDIIKFMINGSRNLWESGEGIDKDNGTADPTDDYTIHQYNNTNNGNVGVGLSDPTEQLDVNGDIQAFGIHANGLCDEDGKNCMLPNAIGGELPEMRCPAGEVIISIYANSVQCASPFTASSFGDCPIGFGLRGISTSGPICDKL